MTRREGLNRMKDYLLRFFGSIKDVHGLTTPAHRFVTLWATISRIPLPSAWWPSERIPKGEESLTMIPLAGAVLGALATLPVLPLTLILNPSACAWIASALYVAAGWSLHLDGWGDLWDGIGSGKRGEEMRLIMKDSRSGSFGVAALVVAIGMRSATLAVIPVNQWLLACALAGGVGRFAIAVTACIGDYPWENGMARDHIANFSEYHLFCTMMATLPLVLLSPFGWATGMLLASAVGVGITLWVRGLLGGVNGDVLGAAAVLGELLVLICYAAKV